MRDKAEALGCSKKFGHEVNLPCLGDVRNHSRVLVSVKEHTHGARAPVDEQPDSAPGVCVHVGGWVGGWVSG